MFFATYLEQYSYIIYEAASHSATVTIIIIKEENIGGHVRQVVFVFIQPM